jgi:hypothetical protein
VPSTKRFCLKIYKEVVRFNLLHFASPTPLHNESLTSLHLLVYAYLQVKAEGETSC